MRKEGRAEWIGRKAEGEERDMAWIYWRKPEEWASVIAEWVEETGQKGAVLTLYEIMEGEGSISQGRRLLGGDWVGGTLESFC